MARSAIAWGMALALAAAGCGEDAGDGDAWERAAEGAVQQADEAVTLAEGAAAAAEEAARAAGQAAAAAEEISGEAASLLAASGFEDDRPAVQMAVTKLGELVVFLPSTVVVTSGSGRALSIYNDTEISHGIQVPGLGVEALLPPGEETRVELPELAGSGVFDVPCHLHGPHRHATLVVLPAP